MKHYTTRFEKTITCTCGKELPSRWVFEGKMGIRTTKINGQNTVQKYCVDCATDEEYSKLISDFSHFMHTK